VLAEVVAPRRAGEHPRDLRGRGWPPAIEPCMKCRP
jgi:hypothetical protein